MTRAQIRSVQRGCNHFTRRYLSGVQPLIVDGRKGVATGRRIRWIKYYLGYSGSAGAQNAVANVAFRSRMWHPKNTRYSTPARIARGMKRRSAQRARWRKNHKSATKTSGVTRFDGVPVANWLVPYLKYARAHGWRGRLVSGWRNPVYSESLCYRICNAPRCPGRCAGKNSNHSGDRKPKGALDVSDYVRFGQIMRQCPLQPRLINTLGKRDPVHYSVSGQ